MPNVTISGAKLFYRDEGSGAVLLLVHAFPLNSTMWDAQIAAFAPTMRVIAPDLPGFGQSILGSGEKSINRYADTLAALFDQLGIECAAVAGLSMGGYTAFALLRRHPHRISALLLADTKATPDSDDAKATRAENAEIVRTHGADALADRMLPTLLSDGAPETLHGDLRAIIHANSRDGMAAALQAMAARADASDLLGSITVPTAIIVGERDTVTPPDIARQMSEQIAGSRLMTIARAGHVSNMENPEAFNAAMTALLIP